MTTTAELSRFQKKAIQARKSTLFSMVQFVFGIALGAGPNFIFVQLSEWQPFLIAAWIVVVVVSIGMFFFQSKGKEYIKQSATTWETKLTNMEKDYMDQLSSQNARSRTLRNESNAHYAIVALNFTREIHRLIFKMKDNPPTTSLQKKHLEENLITTALTMASHISVSDKENNRIDYFELKCNSAKTNLFLTPKDSFSTDRSDNPTTKWDYLLQSDDQIWDLIKGEDLDEPRTLVIRKSDPQFQDKIDGMEWTGKYTTFVSIPVKINGTTFGMLSLNSIEEKQLTDADRKALANIARILALGIALIYPLESIRQKGQIQQQIFDSINPAMIRNSRRSRKNG